MGGGPDQLVNDGDLKGRRRLFLEAQTLNGRPFRHALLLWSRSEGSERVSSGSTGKSYPSSDETCRETAAWTGHNQQRLRMSWGEESSTRGPIYHHLRVLFDLYLRHSEQVRA